MTRTADDLAVLWDRLGLGGATNAAGQSAAGQDRQRRCRIGVVTEIGAGKLEPAIDQARQQTVAALEAAGHELCEASVGELWRWRGAAWELCARDAVDRVATLRDWIDDELSPSTLAALAAGERVDDRRLAEIEDGQRRLRGAVAADLFADQRVDAWLLPLDPTVPRPRNATARPSGASTIPTPDDPDYNTEVGYTTLASFAGLPAISFPVGRCGVPEAPLAMQLVGPRHSERSLIGLAQDVATSIEGPRAHAALRQTAACATRSKRSIGTRRHTRFGTADVVGRRCARQRRRADPTGAAKGGRDLAGRCLRSEREDVQGV